jgi:predicted dehydrogenase
VDKPLAATAAEGRELIAEARRRDLPLTVFQNRRWDGDFLTVRRLLREGAVGRPLRFESRFDRWRPVPKGGWRERADPAEAGGLLYDLGSHLIDQALVLFGAVTHVYAELDRRRSGVEVDDDVFVALSHASGVRSHLSMSTVAAQPGARLRLLGDRAAYVKYGPDGQEDALRTGSRPGGPDWGKEPPERWGTLGAGEEMRAVPTERGAWASFYAELAAALRTGGSLPVDPNDSVSALEIIEAAQRSARDGVVVALGG